MEDWFQAHLVEDEPLVPGPSLAETLVFAICVAVLVTVFLIVGSGYSG